MPQTSYSLDNVAAIAGQVVTKGVVCGKYVASEEIPAGRFVELHTDGKLRLPQGTSLAKVVGVSVYRGSKEPGAWAVDDYVPVLRSGQIWVDSTATTIADLAACNVRHSSTTATHRGKVTDAATSAVAGAEISDPGPALFYGSGPSGLALVELDFCGADMDLDARLDVLEAPILGGALPAFAAGAMAPSAAQLTHNAVHDVPTTAANSTISLPAASVTGTRVFFSADGTKNGHTVQFLDATGAVALTAALTASKRFLAIAQKLGTVWAVTVTSAP